MDDVLPRGTRVQADHEPQPTVPGFVDLLVPETRRR